MADTVDAKASHEATRVFRVLLFAQAEAAAAAKDKNFDLVLSVHGGAWESVDEILTIAGTNRDTIAFEFTVDGLLGTRTVSEIQELLKHGSVRWVMDKALLADAQRAAKKCQGALTIEAATSRGTPAGDDIPEKVDGKG